jgi:hypothetical protein
MSEVKTQREKASALSHIESALMLSQVHSKVNAIVNDREVRRAKNWSKRSINF